MRNSILISLLVLVFFHSCKKDSKQTKTNATTTVAQKTLAYANGFTINNKSGYKEIKVTDPWPNAKNTFTYILYPKGTVKPSVNKDAIFIETPIETVVVTSTTDIPMLEFLNLEHKLIGFPNTEYISSEKTRRLIDRGKIKELGSEHQINTEVVLELDPDIIVGFSATGDTKAYDLIQKAGIPVIMNGSWMEQHPLGRAEWIKFIAVFFNKEKEAHTIFEKIERDYNEAAALAKNLTKSPTVLSGGMFKDVWYAPGGNSYVAKFLKDANTNYLWADTPKTGSLSLSFESVLEKAQNATLWIGSGSPKSLELLKEKNNRYTLFDAFKNKNVYSSSLKTGATGGLIYYELGPMRPDLILKDIIKIAHPQTLIDYESYFFEKLK